MLQRYVAAIWDNQSEKQTEYAETVRQDFQNLFPDWRIVFDAVGIFVFCRDAVSDGNERTFLRRREGIIFGKIFTQDQGGDFVALDAILDGRRSEDIIGSQGKELIERYWGRYVAFVRDERRNSTFVIRDPSAGVHCYRTQVNGVHLYFSHVEDVQKLNGFRPDIDWNYVLAHLVNVEFVSARTGLVHVDELLSGECHEIHGGQMKRLTYWDPHRICANDVIGDAEEAIRVLRASTEKCVNAWASSYNSIVHTLSGGLDSAIVLGCIAKAPTFPKVVCLNFYTDSAAGDERHYARSAARLAGYPLIERLTPLAENGLGQLISEIPLSVKPPIRLFGIPVDRVRTSVALEHGAEAFMSGEGGDHILFKTNDVLGAADYVYCHGLDREFLKFALYAARASRRSFWDAIATALRYGFLRRNSDRCLNRKARSHPFIMPDAIDERQSLCPQHPWSAPAARTPNAKAAQISALPNVLHRQPTHGRCEVADVIDPLLSQPILEACLRIPTYMFTLNGWDRGLARTTFADALPRKILYRRWKGTTTNNVNRMLVEHLGFLREFVLNGILAKQNFIDKERLDRLFTIDEIECPENYFPIVRCITGEAWLRKWMDAS